MSAFFVDTSALVKRYLNELGSTWVKGWVEPQAGNDIIISVLTTVEMISVLMRREREKFISASERFRLQNDFSFHVVNEYTVITLDDAPLGLARRLLIKHPLRALDALQLASGLQAAKILNIQPVFISADTRLLTVAAAEGLPTDDPNVHP